jgi:sulfocyanin
MIGTRSAALGAAMIVGFAAVAAAQQPAQQPAHQGHEQQPAQQQTQQATGQAGGGQGSKFMTYDAAAKTVTLDITAALDNAQGGFNFNGGYNGNQTITVPQGWTVNADVKNKDFIPHSAIIITEQKPLPNAVETPDIPRAYTSQLAASTGEDHMAFKASKPGNYFIYCGIPGHGPSGMYIRFVVSPDAKEPTYTM